MLNFLRSMGKNLYESRMNAAYYGVAQYIQREYNTGMTTGELVNMLRKDGFDEVVAKIR